MAPAIITAAKNVIGPVGSLMSVFVPAMIEATMANIMAVYKPAWGPNPLCKPKAKPIGKARIAAVRPPVKSPLNVCLYTDSFIAKIYKSKVQI